MSLNYPGGYVTKSPPTPTSTSAPGIWTMDQALQYIKAGTWPTPPIGDQYFQYTNLLLGTGSTNGAQNNTFLDSSSNNFTITRNGNTTQGSFTPFSQAAGYWGNYFDGTGDYLSVADNAAFTLTANFTVECWIYQTGAFQNRLIISKWGSSDQEYYIYTGGSGIIGFAWGPYNLGGFTNPLLVSGNNAFALNAWTHVAAVRSSNTFTLYVNGTSVSTATFSTGGTDYNGPVTIGDYVDGGYAFAGYISNARIVKGTAVYTSNFTPPTSPLTAITNTSLLTCQSNRFVDNSTNAFAITRNGDTAVVPFQPFGAPTSPYNTTNVGGSGYFDGSGDYLQATAGAVNAIGTGDFQISGWWYLNELKDYQIIFDFRNGTGTEKVPYLYLGSTGAADYYVDGVSNNLSGVFKAKEWTYVLVSRVGSTTKIFRNGTEVLSFTDNTNYVAGRLTLGVNNGGGGTLYYYNGYISGFRVVVGTGTTSSTIPTSPPTAITNTKALLNFTNAGIFDNAAKNDMETVGNAQVITSVTKFGNSMYFDGTGDNINASHNPEQQFGTGDFTVEAWIYPTSITGTTVRDIICKGQNGAGSFEIAVRDSKIRMYTDVVVFTSSSNVTASAWQHIAIVRIGTTLKFYLNGLLDTTVTSFSTNFNDTGNLFIGSFGNGTQNYFTGYISNLRITKGIGRYPYSFTPPTQAFGTIYQAPTTPAADPYFDYTTLLLPGTGTNGAQNNTFLDSSTNAFSITRNGNTTQGTFSPFSQANGYWSNYFDGTGDYLDFPDNAAFRPGTGDFTIEGWFYSTSSSNTSTIKLLGTTTGYQTGGFAILRSAFGADGNFDFIIEPSDVAANVIRLGTFGSSLLNNTWYHFAVARSGTTLSAWVNGVRTDTDTNSTNIDDSGGDALRIGGNRENTSNLWQGYISNIKYNKGTAYYDPTQTTITVPTSPLTNTSGTDLLTCQSNRFVDNSSNAFAATPAGDISVQQFVPFNPTAAYSAGTNGGSGYFDGTGDYLSVAGATALNYGSGDFTIECWYYPTSTSNGEISAQGDGALPGSTYEIKFRNAGYLTINMYSTAGGVTVSFNTSKNWVLNAWNHVAVVRNGNTVTCYMDGVSAGTGDATGASFGVTDNVYVGAGLAGGNVYKGGYIANFRIVKGTAVYTTGFTPPTAPLTAISGTSLLANFTNAGITDATAKNDLETVGNAQISNGQAKWGSTSMYFDGTGDYLLAPNSENFNFGIGDFTIEYWIYFSSASGTVGIFTKRATTSDYAPVLHYLTSGNWAVKFSTGGTTWDAEIITSITPSTSTWYHVAITKYGTSTKLFVNGQELGSTTVSGSLMTNTASISIGSYAANGNSPLTGYIQDFRITKGIARYTQNFTPPTAAFQLL